MSYCVETKQCKPLPFLALPSFPKFHRFWSWCGENNSTLSLQTPTAQSITVKGNVLKTLNLKNLSLMRELPSSTDFYRALDPPQAACSYEFQCSPLVPHASHFIYTIDSPQYYKDQWKEQRNFLFPVLSFNSYLLSIMCHILCWALDSHQAEIWGEKRKSNRLDVDREVNLLRCNEYSEQMSDYV